MDETCGSFKTAEGSHNALISRKPWGVIFDEQEMMERFATTARKMKHGAGGGRKQSHVRRSASLCLTNSMETKQFTSFVRGVP